MLNGESAFYKRPESVKQPEKGAALQTTLPEGQCFFCAGNRERTEDLPEKETWMRTSHITQNLQFLHGTEIACAV